MATKKEVANNEQPKIKEEIIESQDTKVKVDKVAKAGKRSSKSIAEQEAKIAKEERKAKASSVEEPVIKIAPKTRTRLERSGKKLREATKLINKDTTYSLKDAVDLAIKTSTTKFDSTIELHVNLNVDPRQADQNIRGQLVLPSGTGKTTKVAVMAQETTELTVAEKAGADLYGNDEIMQQLDKGQVNFDLLIVTPAMMPKLGKYAKLLGPKGLMPNPKSGTITTNIEKAVKEAKAGRVEYRVDSTGIIHMGCGKVSFGTEKLVDNIKSALSSIKASKPASVKSNFIKSIHLSTSMGPSIKIAVSEI